MLVVGAEVGEGETHISDRSDVYEGLRKGLRILCGLANAEVLVRTRTVRLSKKSDTLVTHLLTRHISN